MAARNVFAAGCSFGVVAAQGGCAVLGCCDSPGLEAVLCVCESDLAVELLVVRMRVGAE